MELKNRLGTSARSLWLPAAAVMGSALGYALVSGTWDLFLLIIVGMVTLGAVLLGARYFGLVVLAVCALPLFSQSYRFPMIWAAIVAWALVAMSERVLRLRDRPATVLGSAERWLPAAFFASALVAQILGSENRVQDLVSKTLALGFGIAIYYLVVSEFSQIVWHRRALLSLCAGSLLVLGLGTLMMLRPDIVFPGMISLSWGILSNDAGYSGMRFSGPLGDYELAAEMLSISAIAFFGIATATQGRGRILLHLLGAVSLGGVLLTVTRGGVLVFALGMAFLMMKRQPLQHRGSTALAGAVVAGLIAVSALFPDAWAVFGRFGEIRYGVDFSQLLNRGNVWPFVFERIATSPGLFLGHGVEYDFRTMGTYPHSLYLYVLYTQGLLGLSILVTFLLKLLGPLVSVIRERAAWSSFSLGSVLVAMFFADQVKIEFMRNYSYQAWIWALLGLVAIGIRAQNAHSALKSVDV